MPSFLLVRQRVKDFSAWKQVYDGHLPKRREAGLTDRYVLRGTDDPSEVILLFEPQDSARAHAFAASPDLRETMMRAGVVDKPDAYFLADAK